MDIYYSYACRDSYLVHAWLKRVQQSGELLDLRWHPYAIQIDDPIEYWDPSWQTANSELRGFIAAEAAKRQGRDFFYLFHDALESAVHEQFLELGDEATLIGAAEQAGLDLQRFRASWQDPQIVEAIQQSYNLAVEQWNVFGTPTIIFSDGRSLHLELKDIPSGADALELFQTLDTVAVGHPYIKQLTRTTE